VNFAEQRKLNREGLMKRRLLCFGSAAVLFLLSNETNVAQSPRAVRDTRQSEYQQTGYRGGLVTPPLPKPRFTLTDTSGAPFDFRAETDGYVTLLFFGYTHCMSVCPTQIGYLAGAMRRMPKDVARGFKVVFVSTDPTRDNPRLLRSWLSHFDKGFIGLTGSEAEVKAAQVAAHVPSSGGSAGEHAAFVLAYTKDNLGHVIYPAGVTQADWLHDLPQLATETWTGPMRNES
jgi:protein SCO1